MTQCQRTLCTVSARNLVSWFSGKSLKLLYQMSDFKAKMHQNPKFGWDSAWDPAGGVYSAPQTPLAGFKGAYF